MEDVTDPKTLMKIQLGDATRIEKPTFDATFKDSGYGYGHIIGTYRGKKLNDIAQNSYNYLIKYLNILKN